MTVGNGASPSIDRFNVPLYTVTEAARYLDVPDQTVRDWSHGYRKTTGSRIVVGPPILTSIPATGWRLPTVPFIGLAEGTVLSAIRRSGVPLQRIRPALAAMQRDFGIEHALASRRLYSDGAELLFDYAEHGDDPDAARAARQLVVIRSGQRVFNDMIDSYLRRIDFDNEYACRIRLPAYHNAEILVDPARGFGQPVFAVGGARLEDALDLFRAGEPLDVVADEYGMSRADLEDALRVAARYAA